MTKHFRRRIPRQRRTLGQGSPDLPPESLEQWGEVMLNEEALRRYTRSRATAAHEDEVFVRALLALSTRLEKGPVDGSVLAYMKRVCRNAAARHHRELAKRAREELVGSETWRLEDAAPVIDVDPTTRIELAESLQVLRNELSEQQMTVWLLAEYEGLTCYQISDALDGAVSPLAVRQSLKLARDKLRRPATRTRLGLGPLPGN